MIRVEHDPGRLTLVLPAPPGGWLRVPVAAFIGFWLCGWAFGWVMVAGRLVNGGPLGGGQLFALFWLGAWTVGGGFALYSFWQLVRPGWPEGLLLEPDTLTYDPGRTPAQPRWGWYGGGWSADPRLLDLSRRPRRPVTLPRPEVARVALERVGERQRLTFDRGADRVEIGPFLREPEREWLFAVLEAWRTE